MEKQTAINLLGGTPAKAARVMGYKSVQAVYLWPETLSSAVADRVAGALSRMKMVSDVGGLDLAPAAPKQDLLKLADGLELVDRRTQSLPHDGPDRRRTPAASADIAIVGKGI